MRNRWIIIIVGLVLCLAVGLWIGSCRHGVEPRPTETVMPTSTSTATPTPTPLTATWTPTWTLEPTATTAPPTETLTNTAAPTETAIPTATITPTSTPLPVIVDVKKVDDSCILYLYIFGEYKGRRVVPCERLFIKQSR